MIYIALTVLLIVFLIISGLPVYDSLINAFSTAGTGGFSSLNASIGGYNSLAAEIVITIFMFLFGVNFSLYFLIFDRKFSRFIRDAELKVYFGVVAAAIIIIAINISGLYGGFANALRHSSFQVSSIISTTGYATADFNLWPTLSKVILVFLMASGAVRLHRRWNKTHKVYHSFSVKIELGKIFHPGRIDAYQSTARG